MRQGQGGEKAPGGIACVGLRTRSAWSGGPSTSPGGEGKICRDGLCDDRLQS